MGFFTSSKDGKKKKNTKYPTLPSRPSLTGPPNIYSSSPRPPKQQQQQQPTSSRRPATAAATSLPVPAVPQAPAQAQGGPPQALPVVAPHPFYAQQHIHANYSQPLLRPAPRPDTCPHLRDGFQVRRHLHLHNHNNNNNNNTMTTLITSPSS
ncbi:hypothetical protein PT974_04586 [Cladobotryum mycophilum]|uniref:Uncharacterized protein n=1 Tax=Cladobotryum mycophilum TaxID=491253 RepID=A0ABR0SVH3_9HYPO